MHFLGTIAGASGAYNNLATGVSGLAPFTIPVGARQIYLSPAASGLQFEIFGATGATNTTAVRGAPMGAGLAGPFRVPPGPGIVIGIYNSIGGVVNVGVFTPGGSLA